MYSSEPCTVRTKIKLFTLESSKQFFYFPNSYIKLAQVKKRRKRKILDPAELMICLGEITPYGYFPPKTFYLYKRHMGVIELMEKKKETFTPCAHHPEKTIVSTLFIFLKNFMHLYIIIITFQHYFLNSIS